VDTAARYREDEAAVTDEAVTLELSLEPPVTTFSSLGGIGAASTLELVFRKIPKTKAGSRTRRNTRIDKFLTPLSVAVFFTISLRCFYYIDMFVKM
jgi:hypothetical protein